MSANPPIIHHEQLEQRYRSLIHYAMRTEQHGRTTSELYNCTGYSYFSLWSITIKSLRSLSLERRHITCLERE